MRRSALILLALAGAASVGACDTAGRHLYMAHNTILGVDAAVNTDPPKGHLAIGYDRHFGAWIPRSAPYSDKANGATSSDPRTEKRDAMTAIACSRIAVDGLYLTQFTEYLATGPAAEEYAKALKTSPGSQLHECLDAPVTPPQ